MKKKIIPISLCGLLAGGLITGIILHFWGTQKENIVNSLYPYVSQEELVETADLIALGKFTGQSEAYLLNSIDPPPPDNQGLATEIFTKYHFQIDQVFKGVPYDPNTIEIRLEGGTFEGVTHTYEDHVEIKEGETYLIFVFLNDQEHFKEPGNYYRAFQGTRGFFTLGEDQIWHNQDVYQFSSLKNLN